MCLCAPQGNQADCSSNDYWAGKGYNRNAGERLFCSKSFTDAIIIYSFVKSNFKDGLYSSTFWFERIFISKIALVVLCPFSRKNCTKTTQNERNHLSLFLVGILPYSIKMENIRMYVCVNQNPSIMEYFSFIFSITRRSRSDMSESVTESVMVREALK